jgi:DNA-directed RNA polymerase subunit RPC12/RpoP
MDELKRRRLDEILLIKCPKCGGELYAGVIAINMSQYKCNNCGTIVTGPGFMKD